MRLVHLPNLVESGARLRESAPADCSPRRRRALLDPSHAGPDVRSAPTLLPRSRSAECAVAAPHDAGTVRRRRQHEFGRRIERSACRRELLNPLPQRLRGEVLGIETQGRMHFAQRSRAIADVELGARVVQVLTNQMPSSSGLHGATGCKSSSGPEPGDRCRSIAALLDLRPRVAQRHGAVEDELRGLCVADLHKSSRGARTGT